jgi:hypothetical protein
LPLRLVLLGLAFFLLKPTLVIIHVGALTMLLILLVINIRKKARNS